MDRTLPTAAPLAVLNPGGRDAMIDYGDGPGIPGSGLHPPVNFHAYAAATRGAFCDAVEQVLDGRRFGHCLVLLRRRLRPCLEAVRRLQGAGLKVWVAWKECSPFQIAAQLEEPKLWGLYEEVLGLSDAVVTPTLGPPPLPPNLREPRFLQIPTPYPVDLPAWDFSCAPGDRRGIFLGTRELFTASRNHLAALSTALRVARRTGTHVTVINADKSRGRRLLDAVGRGVPAERFRIIESRLPYPEYLRRMAAHRVVFQLDRGGVPGQVAGDALLCRTVCVGGNSAIEQLAFPAESHPNLSDADAASRLEALLTDETVYRAAIESSQQRALQNLSFATVAQQVRDLQGMDGRITDPAHDLS
ncbi:MAG: hypothetical protein KGS60_14080 [Verrucomicrobia bacterium]|nr:hypothetical protein [Verrucomicrobiota bacterium]